MTGSTGMNILVPIFYFIIGGLAFLYYRRKGVPKTPEELVEQIVKKAFENVDNSDHKEHELVKALYKSENFIQDLSLTAKYKGKTVGYILFTKAYVGENEYLVLAPLAVLPRYQKKGVGKNLVTQGQELAKKKGFKGVFVLGDPKYYSKFGYKPASQYGIKAPMEVNDENFMAIELIPGAFDGVTGTLEYAKEFGLN
ncbi:GNAT family N-acetyltransferase [Cetobacterium sp. SF1]|uniref:GNAT family N-acetyltransferase n=1 Tax=unclassified Cetobacterium TaxID=2630983 RepID=UPI003CF174A1